MATCNVRTQGYCISGFVWPPSLKHTVLSLGNLSDMHYLGWLHTCEAVRDGIHGELGGHGLCFPSMHTFQHSVQSLRHIFTNALVTSLSGRPEFYGSRSQSGSSIHSVCLQMWRRCCSLQWQWQCYMRLVMYMAYIYSMHCSGVRSRHRTRRVNSASHARHVMREARFVTSDSPVPPPPHNVALVSWASAMTFLRWPLYC